MLLAMQTSSLFLHIFGKNNMSNLKTPGASFPPYEISGATKRSKEKVIKNNYLVVMLTNMVIPKL